MTIEVVEKFSSGSRTTITQSATNYSWSPIIIASLQLLPNDTTGQGDILLSTPNRLAIEFEKLSQVVKNAESEWKETKRVRAEAKKNNAQLRRLEKEIVKANKHWVALRDELHALKDQFGNETDRVYRAHVRLCSSQNRAGHRHRERQRTEPPRRDR